MLAKEIMTKEVITINKDAATKEAMEVLAVHNISGLPVVDSDDTLVGILSDTDLVVGGEENQEYPFYYPSFYPLTDSFSYIKETESVEQKIDELYNTKVEDVMNSKVISVKEDDTIHHVVRLMAQHHIERVPVTSNGKLVGIISQKDVIRSFSENKIKELK